MRSILFHAKNYRVEFESFANKPKGIIPESVEGKRLQELNDCILAFITVEIGDRQELVVDGLLKEIIKMSREVGRTKAVIVPFAHLSNKLASPSEGLMILKSLESSLSKHLEVTSTHFGSNKSLLLEIYGHAGNVRYREF